MNKKIIAIATFISLSTFFSYSMEKKEPKDLEAAYSTLSSKNNLPISNETSKKEPQKKHFDRKKHQKWCALY